MMWLSGEQLSASAGKYTGVTQSSIIYQFLRTHLLSLLPLPADRPFCSLKAMYRMRLVRTSVLRYMEAHSCLAENHGMGLAAQVNRYHAGARWSHRGVQQRRLEHSAHKVRPQFTRAHSVSTMLASP